MTQSIGRDVRTRGKFHIVGIDQHNGTVWIRHFPDGWSTLKQNLEPIQWSELVRAIAEGHIEFTSVRSTES